MKKVLIIAAVLAVAYFAFKKPNTDEAATTDTVTENGKRELTDAEAQKYLNENPDLADAFGANNLEKAKWHWMQQGYMEPTRPSPYLS